MTSIKSQDPNWRPIREYEDIDPATSFNFDESGWPPRYAYRLTFQVEDHFDGGSGGLIQLRVEGDTTSNYVNKEFNGVDSLTAQDNSTVDGTYGTEEEGVIKNNRTRTAELNNNDYEENTRDHWRIGFTGQSRSMFAKVVIGGGNYVNEPASPNPTVSVVNASDPRLVTLSEGILLNTYSTITDIRLFSSQVSTGKAVLEGWGPISDR